jgi:hypothetical protein
VIRTAARELVEVSVERAPERDVQDLAASAHAEDGHLVLHGEQRVGEIDLVQVGLPGQVLRVRFLATVAPGLDVSPPSQDQAVDALDQFDPVLLPFVEREEDGQGAGCEQRAPVPVAVVVAVVGEPLGDRDERATDQVRASTIVSNHASNSLLP